MTATQVVNRFIKDYKYYWFHNLIGEAYANRITKKGVDFDYVYGSLRKHFGDEKGLMVDCLMKHYHASLCSFISSFYFYELGKCFGNGKPVNASMFNKLRSDFQKFLKENVKGYRKPLIPDFSEEFNFGYRYGYHYVDFEYK